MKLYELLELKDFLESIERNEAQQKEYTDILDELHDIRTAANKKSIYLTNLETDSANVHSNVEIGDDKKSCRICGKEEMLFTGLDVNSMARHGCCRNCFYLFVE